MEYLTQQEMYRAERRDHFVFSHCIDYFSSLDLLIIGDAGHLTRIDLGWSVKPIMLSKN